MCVDVGCIVADAGKNNGADLFGLHAFANEFPQRLRFAAHLLTRVNDREELREHDLQAIRMIYRILFTSRNPPHRISTLHLKDLERILGRDDELDEIILHSGEHRAQDLQAPLERLLKQMQPASARTANGFT